MLPVADTLADTLAATYLVYLVLECMFMSLCRSLWGEVQWLYRTQREVTRSSKEFSSWSVMHIPAYSTLLHLHTRYVYSHPSVHVFVLYTYLLYDLKWPPLQMTTPPNGHHLPPVSVLTPVSGITWATLQISSDWHCSWGDLHCPVSGEELTLDQW